jgi:hypothetical protein
MKLVLIPFLSLFLLLSTSLTAAAASASPFQCTFSAADEASCLDQTSGDDPTDHCVWCSLSSSFGFCVNEAEAESMEQSIPGTQCDRYSGGDDDAHPNPTDDAVPNPTDDAVPDNFWQCLQDQDVGTCQANNCTWCDTKAGFGLCMTGPTAEAAADSAWFTCRSTKTTTTTTTTTTRVVVPMEDPYDTSCVLAFLKDQTEQGCVSAVDQDGRACEWCDLQGMSNLCLNADQAEAAAALGITCEENGGVETTRVVDEPKKKEAKDNLVALYDRSCENAFWQDQTEQGCVSAVDQDGRACKWCDMQGMMNLCLNADQALAAEPLGITCEDASSSLSSSVNYSMLRGSTTETY